MIQVITKYPIAYDSPDHICPWGTKHDNSTSLNFIQDVEKHFNNEIIRKGEFVSPPFVIRMRSNFFFLAGRDLIIFCIYLAETIHIGALESLMLFT